MRKPIQLVRSGNGNTKHLITGVVKDFSQAVFLVFGSKSKQLGGKVFAIHHISNQKGTLMELGSYLKHFSICEQQAFASLMRQTLC